MEVRASRGDEVRLGLCAVGCGGGRGRERVARTYGRTAREGERPTRRDKVGIREDERKGERIRTEGYVEEI
mgnify:CR=1 FL=1